ncbi:MAG TPA: potassium-transporting ATPase subunit KdpB [Myxococcota bacterium]|nr:potassium-transporting ATPase subunit KdpB [Myxococcota bacterium]
MAKRIEGTGWGDLAYESLFQALKKFHPKSMAKNPVMLVTWIGSLVTSIAFIINAINGQYSGFELQITLWLWFTVLFANFAEALAEGRGKAQAESLKRARVQLHARKITDGHEERVPASLLKVGDLLVCEAGDTIPADGEIVEGIASIDESAITGESAPVIRESGGDRSAVTGGTRVISDRVVIKVTAEQGKTFLDRIIGLIENASRQKTPNEEALNIVLVALTVILLFAVITLKAFTIYSVRESGPGSIDYANVFVLVSLLVCLIPTTIGALLSAIGIAGMDRLIRKNVIAKSGRAVEAAGDIDVMLIDKTGTITLGNRMAFQFIPAPGFSERDLAQSAQIASLSDETPEGRSIVVLAKERFDLRAESLNPKEAHIIPFSAETRMSGIDITHADDGVDKIRKGAVDAISAFVKIGGGSLPRELKASIDAIAGSGGTPLLVAKNHQVLGVVGLKDVVKGGIKERFMDLRRMGIKTVMITGDNPMTAAAIAAEAGVDDFIAEATPESKLARIRKEQKHGKLIAMTGDGTNDAPALAQADVGIAMNTGTQAAREAGNMVDLDSNPTKVIEIVETGKQMLMTRGSLTTFSIANDIAKYFAILPAIFATLYSSSIAPGPLSRLNVMQLHSAQSAILSAVIFNALIIIALIPLALRGVSYRPISATSLLQRNLLVYGVGGIISPFIGIKLIDWIIVGLRWVG